MSHLLLTNWATGGLKYSSAISHRGILVPITYPSWCSGTRMYNPILSADKTCCFYQTTHRFSKMQASAICLTFTLPTLPVYDMFTCFFGHLLTRQFCRGLGVTQAYFSYLQKSYLVSGNQINRTHQTTFWWIYYA